MPLLRIPSSEAKRRLRSEGSRVKWPEKGSAGKRLDGVADVSCSPSFEIGKDDKIFTIGSCFARNIERRLYEIGFQTVIYHERIRAELAALGESWPFLNKYNAPTIRTEMAWALDLEPVAEELVYLPLPNGNVLDVHLNGRSKQGSSLEEARTRREFVAALMRQLPQCRIVVITLGLVEVWRDLKSGLGLNVAPGAAADAEPDRFVLDVLSYDEVLGELEQIHALLTARGHPDFRVLITVSPVPLNMTFRSADVITANAYSKCVQRAAVEAFVLGHDNVDYFPSFETVTMTDRRLAFEIDNRHVQPGVVARVVDRAIAAYAPGLQFEETDAPLVESHSENRPQDLLRSAEIEMSQEHYEQAAHYLAMFLDRYGDRTKYIKTADLRLRYSSCLLKRGMNEAGLQQVTLAANAPDASPGVLLKCAQRLLTLGEHAQALGIAQNLVQAGETPDAVRKGAQDMLQAMTAPAVQ